MRSIAAVVTLVSAVAVVVHLQALPQSQEPDVMRGADAPPNAPDEAPSAADAYYARAGVGLSFEQWQRFRRDGVIEPLE